MRPRRDATTVAAALVLTLAACPAGAGTVITGTHTTFGTTPEKTTTRFLLEPDRVRMESGNETMIFRGDKQLVWIVDTRARSYREMTKAGMQKMGAQVSAQMAEAQRKIDETLKEMPAEQRAMVEAMLKGQQPGAMPPGAAPAPSPGARSEYVKVGRGSVGDWSCDEYERSEKGQVVAKVCAADPGELGIPAAHVRAFERMGTFFEDSLGPFRDRLGAAPRVGGRDVSGVPLRTVRYRGGAVRSEDVVQQVDVQDLDPALFELPAGFSRQAGSGRMGPMGEIPR